jgi:PAS domain S-box-containing protein
MRKDSVLRKLESKNRLGKGRLSSHQNIAPEILDTIPATLNVVDVHYNVLAIGGTILRTSESHDKIIGKKCHKVFQKRDKPCPWCKIAQVIKTGEVVNEMTTPDDPREKLTKKPLSVYVCPLKGKDGNIIGALELATDISHIRKANRNLKKAHESIRRSEQRIGALLNASTESAFLMNTRGIVLASNETAAQRLGKSVDEVIGTNVYDLLPKKISKQRKKRVDEVLRSRKALRFEDEPDGRVLDHSVYPVFDKRGRVIQLAVFTRDITRQKRAENKLKQREALLKIQATELQEVNSALRVLLKQREADKTEIEAKVLLNVKELVLPYVQKLKKSRLHVNQKAFLSIVESNLKGIVLPFARKLSLKYAGLSPAEIRTAHLIRDGKSTKEIAELLNVSPSTIESRRKDIRAKIGIRNRKVNLRSHLLSM